MKYQVHARFLMGDLTFYEDADSDEDALRAAHASPFGETLKLAKSIAVFAIPPVHEPLRAAFNDGPEAEIVNDALRSMRPSTAQREDGSAQEG